MNETELIEEYLAGKLQRQALKEFERRLASDPALASQVQDHRLAQEMTFTLGLLETREKLHRIHTSRSFGSGNRKWLGGSLLAILSLILISSAYLYFNKATNTQPRSSTTAPSSGVPEKTEFIRADTLVAIEHSTEKTDRASRNSNKDKLSVPGMDTLKPLGPQNAVPLAPDTVLPATKNRTSDDPLKAIKEKPAVIPCDGIRIKASVSTEESCEDNPTGSLYIHSISGGKAPYRFSLNEGREYTDSHFHHLLPGTYTIGIKDAGGCTGAIEAEIPGKPCPSEKGNAFAPDQGETWKFPLSPGSNCRVRILDAAGNPVYQVTTNNGFPAEWNGQGMNDTYIKAGAYLYEITCEDGSSKQGSVTVIR